MTANATSSTQSSTYAGSIISFRNDRMGARLMTLMNTIRIAQDYDAEMRFTWKMDGRTSEELLTPTEIFDETYFHDHYVPIEDYRDLGPTALDITALPPDFGEDELRTALTSGRCAICQGSNLIVFPWEKHDDVAPAYANAIHQLRFSPDVTKAMSAVDNALSGSGTALHIRRGDIIHDPITSNQPWSNKYIPREFYEIMARRITVDPNARILVFSDEPAEITRLKAMSPQIMGAADVIPQNLTIAQRDFIELYAMSRCRTIFGPPNSGFSLTAGLLGNRTVQDVCAALTPDEYTQALDLLVTRLEDTPEVFLTDGDIAQSLLFATDHLNKTGDAARAMKILKTCADRGLCKLFFYKLLLTQHIVTGDFKAAPTIINQFKNAPIDRAIPGRLEMHWAEVARLAAISATHAGDTVDALHHIKTALWYSANHRPNQLVLTQLCATGVTDPDNFAIPFDPDLQRTLPPAMRDTFLSREADPALILPGMMDDNIGSLRIFPTDIIARDWGPFLSKNLARGFKNADTINAARTTMQTQFTREATRPAIHSAQALYAGEAGHFEDALDLHGKATRGAPENPLYFKRAGVTRATADPHDPEATRLLEIAAELGGPDSLYAAQLAQHLSTLGLRQQATAMMQTVCDGPNVLPEIAYLTALMLRHDRRRGAAAFEQGLRAIHQALAMTPHVRRFLSLKVHLLCDLDRKADATTAVERIETLFGALGDVSNLRKRIAGLTG